jgi:hypothetical protein
MWGRGKRTKVLAAFAQTKKKVLTKDAYFKIFLFLIECMSLSNKFEITKKICNN